MFVVEWRAVDRYQRVLAVTQIFEMRLAQKWGHFHVPIFGFCYEKDSDVFDGFVIQITNNHFYI